MDSNDKVFGILSYIGILWIVGLAAGKTPFAKFHANQGLVLFLAEIVIGIAGGILSVIPFHRRYRIRTWQPCFTSSHDPRHR